MRPMELELPEGPMTLRHLVLDFTGTLSGDGALLSGVAPRLRRLGDLLTVTVLTADTFGTAHQALEGLPVRIRIIADGAEKARVVREMGPRGVMAVGNGRNDAPMMEVAELSVAVVGPEGAAAELLTSAHIVVRDINDALDLPLNPLRVKATLRD